MKLSLFELVFLVNICCVFSGALFVASIPFGIAGLSEIYARLPQNIVYGSTPPLLNENILEKNIFLLFPGAGGTDQNTIDLTLEAKRNLKDYYVECYDWKRWCGNLSVLLTTEKKWVDDWENNLLE